MKKFILRPGIVITSICGQYLLVAKPEAMPYCKRISQINEMAAEILRLISVSSKSIEDIADLVLLEYKIPKECDLQSELSSFLVSMKDNGYIIEE